MAIHLRQLPWTSYPVQLIPVPKQKMCLHSELYAKIKMDDSLSLTPTEGSQGSNA